MPICICCQYASNLYITSPWAYKEDDKHPVYAKICFKCLDLMVATKEKIMERDIKQFELYNGLRPRGISHE